MPEYKDRVKDQTATTGTGSFVLDLVAPVGFRPFSAHTSGATVRYSVANQLGTEWEVGEGVWSPVTNTLSRITIFASSAGGNARTAFTAGVKTVVSGPIAQDLNDSATRTGAEELSNKTLVNPRVKRTTLTDATSVTWDLNAGSMASVTIAGNRTISDPSNMREGASYWLFITQDSAGNRTVNWGPSFRWSAGQAPVLTTTAGRTDVFHFVSDGQFMYGQQFNLNAQQPGNVLPPAPAPGPNDNLADGWPARILATYYPSWFYERIKVNAVSTNFNVIFLHTCRFNTNGSGAVIAWEWPEPTTTQLQSCMANGQRIILTVGGSTSKFVWQNQTQAQNFVTSIIDMIDNRFGGRIQGLDFNNYEGLTPNSTWMIWIAEQLRNKYGSTFAITTPAAPNSSVDQQCVLDMKNAGALTWVAPQYYDWVGFKYQGFISSLPKLASDPDVGQGNGGRHKTWCDLLGDQTKVCVGLSANYNFSNSLTQAECVREWDRLISDFPNTRGLFAWNALTEVLTTNEPTSNPWPNNSGSQGAAEGGGKWGALFRQKLNGLGPVSAPAPAPSSAPTITTLPHKDDWLQVGNAADAYFITDNRWGAGSIVEGPGADQYMQEAGRFNTPGSLGEVAFRHKWRWPTHTSSMNEVKNYPAILAGAKPGYHGPDHRPAWEKWIRMPDGATATVDKYGAALTQTGGGSVFAGAPTGPTPGTFMPVALTALNSLRVKFSAQFLTDPTGIGQFVIDIWLTSHNLQEFGFRNAPVTHEIMIPVAYWGNYGAVNNTQSWSRNGNWYDHDVTLGGRAHKVYATKNGTRNPVGGATGSTVYTGLHYNFPFAGSQTPLSGKYTNSETGQPRIGWKMIALVPSAPTRTTNNGLVNWNYTPDSNGVIEIDLLPYLKHIQTRNDSRAVKWGTGTEFLMSYELGSEVIQGAGDIVVWNHKLWRP